MDIKDLEEIKQLLAKNGYKVTIEKAIDWSNVKYVKRVAIGNSYEDTVLGKIERLPKPFTPGQPYIPFCYRSAYFLEVYAPATKEEIETYLRKEAVERFGTIKLGDNFIMADGREFLPFFDLSRTWLYNEELDELWFHDLLVYREGKWAERVPQKIKAIYAGTKVDRQDKSVVVDFTFRLTGVNIDQINLHRVGDYLQSKLEEYLNKK